MRYVKLGKLSYSNVNKYIGGFIEVTELNFTMICNMIDEKINGNKTFKKNRNKFIYAFEYKNKEIDGIIVNVEMKLFIAFDYENKWEFELLNEPKHPDISPFKITYEKNFIKGV